MCDIVTAYSKQEVRLANTYSSPAGVKLDAETLSGLRSIAGRTSPCWAKCWVLPDAGSVDFGSAGEGSSDINRN